MSVLATGMTTMTTIFTRVWLRRTEVAPDVLDDKTWKLAILITVTIVAVCIGVIVHYRAPCLVNM